MKKYFCEFCNKMLLNDKLKSRKMHNDGMKHNLMRKAYYMEVFCKKEAVFEIMSVLKDMKVQERTNISDKRSERTFFEHPPCVFPANFTIPKDPIGFKLPSGFDFHNKKNFPKNIDEAILKYR